jgi:hypothetical protein
MVNANGSQRAALPEPWRFAHPIVGQPFAMTVVRIELGWAHRPIDDPPSEVHTRALRTWLLGGSAAGAPDYYDWSHRSLVDRIPVLYNLEPKPLRLVLHRLGYGQNSAYDIEVLAHGQPGGAT